MKNKEFATIVMIPGGPGLSAQTMRKLSSLETHFNLVFYDPPGTGGRPEPKQNDYRCMIEDLSNVTADLSGPIILCGHSFGGIVAADLFLREKSRFVALICLSTPFSSAAFKSASQQYEKFQTTELTEATMQFESKPSNDSFRNWLSCYGDLYFSEKNKTAGKDLLLNDQVSVSAFQTARADALLAEPLLAKLKQDSRPKYFLSGLEDKLILPNVAKNESELGGFEFFGIPQSSHFLQFERPDEIYKIIKNLNFKQMEG